MAETMQPTASAGELYNGRIDGEPLGLGLGLGFGLEKKRKLQREREKSSKVNWGGLNHEGAFQSKARGMGKGMEVPMSPPHALATEKEERDESDHNQVPGQFF